MRKSISKILVATILLLSFASCNAQTKNTKEETVKIYGNCEMCKSTIEKAGNIKNESYVVWDKETKMATLSYDSLKTTKEKILKRIALVGYDSDSFLAPDDAYANLSSCCQYPRAKQTIAKTAEPKMEVEKHDHSMHKSKSIDGIQEVKPLAVVYESYYMVKDALVKTDAVLAATNANVLFGAINEVIMDKLPNDVHIVWMKVSKDLKEDAEHISDSKDIIHQRAHFATLSKNIYELIKISKTDKPTYYQFCPMANDGKGANWLSKEETVKNPYYGSMMLSCGKTVETLK